LTLQVLQSEPLGANTLLHGKVGTEAFTASVQGVHKVDSQGEDFTFSVAPENLHFFDPETGKRLDF